MNLIEKEIGKFHAKFIGNNPKGIIVNGTLLKNYFDLEVVDIVFKDKIPYYKNIKIFRSSDVMENKVIVF